MAERRSGDREIGKGLKATVALGVLGIVSGFAVGMVAGIGWEEPALVFDYLAGDTQEIDWSSPDSAMSSEPALADRSPEAPLPAISASPPADPLGLRGAAADAPEISEAPETPRLIPDTASAAREPVPGDGYSIQVGAFSDASSAHRLIGSLREKGYRVYVSRGEGAEANWRVRVGPLRTRVDAENTALQLERREKLPTWILSEGS